jgi:hypothetical protein
MMEECYSILDNSGCREEKGTFKIGDGEFS